MANIDIKVTLTSDGETVLGGSPKRFGHLIPGPLCFCFAGRYRWLKTFLILYSFWKCVLLKGGHFLFSKLLHLGELISAKRPYFSVFVLALFKMAAVQHVHRFWFIRPFGSCMLRAFCYGFHWWFFAALRQATFRYLCWLVFICSTY